MGYHSSDRSTFEERAAYRATTGTDFAHDRAMRSAPLESRHVHPSLDPKHRNKNGVMIRECLSSPAHPNALGVVVGFDETGSMADGPVIIKRELPKLKGATDGLGMLDLQFLFACYGDAEGNQEVAPLQVGQFESGDSMEDCLNNMYLEKNGGGNGGESSGLLLWFLSVHSSLESLEKNQQKGICFLIGDERPLNMIRRSEVDHYVGGGLEADVSIEAVVASVTAIYDVYFLLVDNSSARAQRSHERWAELLGGDHVVIMPSLDCTSEVLAMLLARLAGEASSINDVAATLVENGCDRRAVRQAADAVSRIYTGEQRH